MLPFLYSDPDASEETTAGGTAVAEEQTPDTPGDAQGELFDGASEQTGESATSPETPSKPTDADEFVGLRQTARQDYDSDLVPFRTIGKLSGAAIGALAAMLLEMADERQEEEVDDTDLNGKT